MDCDRQPTLGGRLEDREGARLAVGPVGASAEQDLDEALVLRAAADLLRRRLRVLAGAEDRGAKARFLLQPAFAQPLVVCARELGGAVRARDQRDEDGVVPVQDPDLGAARVEHLTPNGFDGRAGRMPVLLDVRPPPGGRVRPRVARKSEGRALCPEPLALRRIDVGEKFLQIADLRVDVAIDHGQDDSSRDVSDSTEGWDWLGAFLEGPGLAGVAVAVADEAGERFFVSKGWAELRRKAIDRETLFELGSVGKTFTALLVLQLVDEGTIDLGAPVTSYLPWFEVRSEFAPITVEHLLTHSASLIRGADMSADSRFDVWALRQTQTGFPPGERHYYSNVGFRTLGYMLEDVTGLRYPALGRARLLEPLGLTGMAPELTADVRLQLAVGYERLHDDRVPDPADPLVPAPWADTDTGDGCLAG